MRKLFIGGNWKCNNTLSQTGKLLGIINKIKPHKSIDVVVSPVFLHIPYVNNNLSNDYIKIAAQNISRFGMGANTGEISVNHLNDFNVDWVILGHSERREKFSDNDEHLKMKFQLAKKEDKSIIYCIGEPLNIREEKNHVNYIKTQLDSLLEVVDNYWDKVVIAYEPIWAIGTGKVANIDEVNEIHNEIRKYLIEKKGDQVNKTRIIYGGSVGKNNCENLIKIDNVDGFLIGGASLKEDFVDIFNLVSDTIDN